MIDVNIGLRMLHAAGVGTLPTSAREVTTDDGRIIQLVTAGRAPTPSDIERDLAKSRSGEILFYVVLRPTHSLIQRATIDHRIGYASLSNKEIVLSGRRISLEFNEKPAAAPAARGPRPYGRFAVARSLLRTDRPQTQTILAAATGLTQAAVSKAVHGLGERVVRDGPGWVAAEASELFDFAVNAYPGAGGISVYWYSGEAITEQARTIAALARDALISGDVAANDLAPWRISRTAAVYARTGVPAGTLPFGESEPTRATLKVTVPKDQTVWATALHWWGGLRQFTDPIITAHEVLCSGGGGDEREAVDKIRDSVLRARKLDER